MFSLVPEKFYFQGISRYIFYKNSIACSVLVFMFLKKINKDCGMMLHSVSLARICW